MFKTVLILSLFGLLFEVQSAGVTESVANFQQDALNTHNAYRALHGAAPLTLDANLNALATNWAQQIATTSVVAPRPSTGPNSPGESIYWEKGYNVTGKSVTDYWYKQIQNYDFQTGQSINGNETKNFVEIVWKSTTRMGIGFAKNQSTKITYVVANYSPAGAIDGYYQRNVQPASN